MFLSFQREREGEREKEKMFAQDTYSPMDDGQQGPSVEPNVVDSNHNDFLVDSIPREIESSSLTVNLKRLASDVWNHFKRQKVDGRRKAICNYCSKILLGDARQGTSHL